MESSVRHRNGDIYIVRLLVDNWKTLSILGVIIFSIVTSVRVYDNVMLRLERIDQRMNLQVDLNELFSHNQRLNLVGMFYLTCRARNTDVGRSIDECTSLLDFAPELESRSSLPPILENLFTAAAAIIRFDDTSRER